MDGSSFDKVIARLSIVRPFRFPAVWSNLSLGKLILQVYRGSTIGYHFRGDHALVL